MAELKQQIKDQELLVATSARKLFSVATLSSYVFSSFRKKMNLVDGVLIGFKLVRSIRRFIRLFR